MLTIPSSSFFHIHRSIQPKKAVDIDNLIYRDLSSQMENSNKECKTHGPWGGSQGKDWVCMPKGFIKRITIVHSGFIDRIRFHSDSHTDTSETQSFIFGGHGGNKTDTICIDYPNEYLTSVSGTFSHVYTGGYGSYSTVVTSLVFRTNQIRYGPYGSGSGTSFSYDGKDEAIVGFFGRADKYIDAFGVYVMPKSLALSRNIPPKDSSKHELHSMLCRKMSGPGMPREAGPWGAVGGMPWDDGVFAHVKQVHVYMVESLKVICGIQFEYVNRDGDSFLSQVHGGTCGNKTELVELDGVKEYLTGVSGFYGPLGEFNGLEGIASITFHTNKKMYGPYGQKSGAGYVCFTSTSSPGKVVGFQGRSGDFLTAIGVHMEYI